MTDSPAPSSRSSPQRIVIIRPSALGDVCRTVPVLASVRHALPGAYIAWVVQDDFADAIAAHPAVDEVIGFPRTRFGQWWRSPRRMLEMQRWFRELRSKRFDVAIDCQGLGRSGLITRVTGARLRIGPRHAREFGWLAYNRRMPEAGQPLPVHTVDQMLALLKPLGIPPVPDMRLYVPAHADAWWKDHRALHDFADDEQYAVIAPGSRWPGKRWPIERFAELVQPLLHRGFSRVVVVGAPSERSQAEPLLRYAVVPEGQRAAVIDLVGRATIAQTMAVIAGAGLVVANDSAPLHMAVGFDRPCVALYGPTDPAAVGPYARAECVLRAYAPAAGSNVNYKDPRLGDSLMRLISTTLALQSIDRVLAMWPQRRSAQPEPLMSSTPSRRTSCTDSAVRSNAHVILKDGLSHGAVS